jgi:hypothetical protein
MTDSAFDGMQVDVLYVLASDDTGSVAFSSAKWTAVWGWSNQKADRVGVVGVK